MGERQQDKGQGDIEWLKKTKSTMNKKQTQATINRSQVASVLFSMHYDTVPINGALQ